MAALGVGEEVKTAINDYIKADVFSGEAARQAALPVILAALDQQSAQLLDIVVYLEKSLSDPNNPQGRRQAIQLLVECLKLAAKLKLNFKHVETLGKFFASKLSDWQCVEGALGGLFVLLTRHGPLLRSLKGGDDAGGEKPFVAVLARRLFKEVHTPSHTQQVRKAALDVVLQLLEGWCAEVSTLGAELGEGVNGTIEEERDPRNLLQSFTLAKRLLEDFEPSCVSEETLTALFETLTSYFPITFTPPKDDKHGITGDHLRAALNGAVSASPRFAGLVVPFLLDSSKDISAGDNDDTIVQALDMLAVCLEAYGPRHAQAHLGEVLAAAQDQVCRTATPCPGAFAVMLRRVLAVSLRDVPTGLHPHWLGRDVIPALKVMSENAAKGVALLSSGGSRRLLLAAGAAHPIILEHTWALLLPALSTKAEGQEGIAASANPERPAVLPLPLDALGFLVELTRLAEGASSRGRPLLPGRLLKSALGSALATLRNLRTAASGQDGGMMDAEASPAVPTCLTLVGRLSRLAGEEASGEAFQALVLMLLPPIEQTAAPDLEPWAAKWRQELAGLPKEDPIFVALVGAVSEVVDKQPTRASELAPLLLAWTVERASPPLLAVLPRLLVAAAVSLARRFTAGSEDAERTSTQAPDVATAERLLDRACCFARASQGDAGASSRGRSEALTALADNLEAAADSVAAASWASSKLALALDMPAELPRLCGMEGAADGQHLLAARRLVRALSRTLPAAEARLLRSRVLNAMAASGGSNAASPEVLQACVGCAPAVLPTAAQEDWELCANALPTICLRACHESVPESAALEAVAAIVEACPQAELETLLESFRSTLGSHVAGGEAAGGGARGAARCWAAAAAALLRRGGCAPQAASLLEALLAGLERDSSVTQHVPVAFQVLMPPQFDGSTKKESVKLPPLALQQLSRTVLPLLIERARVTSGSVLAKRAALESAVTLLCALPVEVVCSDCTEELKWCTLMGLARLQDDIDAARAANTPPDTAVFAAQAMQLLLRAAGRGTAWVEDELHSIVVPLTSAGMVHTVPLVRLGALQALLKLVQVSRGHLAPFHRQVEAAMRRAIEDRRREVRLLAVACLNAWHCGTSADG